MGGFSGDRSFWKRPTGISPSRSLSAGTSHRGIAARVSSGHLDISAFVSFPGLRDWCESGKPPDISVMPGFNAGWFDTKGEWLSCQAASPAWEFLGKPGLPKGDFPANFDTRCIGPYLGYVRRGGQHGLSGNDWNWALDFADQAFGR